MDYLEFFMEIYSLVYWEFGNEKVLVVRKIYIFFIFLFEKRY